MVFHSKEQLDGWLDEFKSEGWVGWDSLRVVIQDGTEGADTGLIALSLNNAATDVFVQCVGEANRWQASFEARDDVVELNAPRLASLSSELSELSSLVEFLQGRSDACADES